MKDFSHIALQRGFTLIETLVALAIYSVLIGTLVVVSQNGLDTVSLAEERALARRALTNVVTDFKQQIRQGKLSSNTGRHTGEYLMANRQYRWEIKLSASQNQLTTILSASIKPAEQSDQLAQLQEIL